MAQRVRRVLRRARLQGAICRGLAQLQGPHREPGRAAACMCPSSAVPICLCLFATRTDFLHNDPVLGPNRPVDQWDTRHGQACSSHKPGRDWPSSLNQKQPSQCSVRWPRAGCHGHSEARRGRRSSAARQAPCSQMAPLHEPTKHAGSFWAAGRGLVRPSRSGARCPLPLKLALKPKAEPKSKLSLCAATLAAPRGWRGSLRQHRSTAGCHGATPGTELGRESQMLRP